MSIGRIFKEPIRDAAGVNPREYRKRRQEHQLENAGSDEAW